MTASEFDKALREALENGQITAINIDEANIKMANAVADNELKKHCDAIHELAVSVNGSMLAAVRSEDIKFNRVSLYGTSEGIVDIICAAIFSLSDQIDKSASDIALDVLNIVRETERSDADEEEEDD